jgi:hypothetical protein
MTRQLHFFNQTDLIHRLSFALRKRSQEVVFFLGAALSAPVSADGPGVLGADQLIDLIRTEFADDDAQLEEFDREVEVAGARRYQQAFLFLQGRLGQPTANEIVRAAVLGARSGALPSGFNLRSARDEELRLLEYDSQWSVNPGTESIGKLVTHYPTRFGRTLLTTNFDPLLEVAIRKAGGQFFKTFLHADGDLSHTEGPGCHVVHLHGYWYGSDTLHTSRQLQQSRPHLRASLATLLRNKLLVICGYSGWDDVFTDAVMDTLRDDSANPEILWAFHHENPTLRSESGQLPDNTLSSIWATLKDRERLVLRTMAERLYSQMDRRIAHG